MPTDAQMKQMAAAAAEIQDPEHIKAIADRLTTELNKQFPDFEPVSFYFRQAVIDTWPKAATTTGFAGVMRRMEERMQEHHNHIFHMIFGDHGYAEDVRELIHALAVNIYYRINAHQSNKPRYTDRWLECAKELDKDPAELKNTDYICWVHKRVNSEIRKKQGEAMGVDPDTVEPYDYELWLMGNTRRRK